MSTLFKAPQDAFKKPWPLLNMDMAPGAGLEILNAAIRDALGRGWQPQPDAERVDGGYRGWFTAGGKRFRIEVALDYGDPRPNAALEDALDDLASARQDLASAEEVEDELRKTQRDLAECRADLKKIRDIVA